MASPQFMLFPKSKNKKLPLMWLDLKVGALFSNQQNVQFYQGQTTPSKEIKSNDQYTQFDLVIDETESNAFDRISFIAS